MANYKLMPDAVDLREVTFTNILLLGFDVELSELQYRIPFTRDMFSVPNRKGMEVILHFLFTKLNLESTKESFRNCWPIIDRKKEQEFRKICTEWLAKIKKQDTESRLPTIVPSLLISPGGDKFYQFLLYFSMYVLTQNISRFPGKYGTLPSWPSVSSANKKYLSQLYRSLTVSAVNKKARLISFVESMTPIKSEWVTFAREQSKEHRKLSKQRRECDREIKELKNIHKEIFGNGTQSSKETLKRTQNLQKVSECWKSISQLFETEKTLKEHIAQVLKSGNEKRSLDGSSINFKVPDILLRECEKQLHAGKRYQNLYEAGKVNLLSLVQLWNLSLHLIKETLAQFPLPDVESDECYIRAEAHNHANNLNSFVALSNSLCHRLLPDAKLSVDELKENVKEICSTKQFKHVPNKLALDFLPVTPPIYFDVDPERNRNSSSSSIHAFRHDVIEDLFENHQHVDTPDAVDVLLRRIKKDTNKMAKDFNEDDTPVRTLPGKNKQASTTKKIPKSTVVKKHNVTAHPSSVVKSAEMRSKIPLLKSLKGRVQNPTKLSFKTPVRHAAEELTKEKSKMATPIAVIMSPCVELADGANTRAVNRAQELLIDQIAQSVLDLTQPSDGMNSDTDEMTDDSKLHAIDNPTEAFVTDAFISRDKVPRTPSSKAYSSDRKSNAKESNRRLLSPLLQTTEEQSAPLDNYKRDESLQPNDKGMRDLAEVRAETETPSPPLLPPPSSSSLPASNAFDLKTIQDRINEMKARGPCSFEESYSTPGQVPASGKLQEDREAFISPLHDMNTPAHSQHERHDALSPLHFSDGHVTPSSFTPSSFTPSYQIDVDFTPIRTPWRLDNQIGTTSSKQRIDTSKNAREFDLSSDEGNNMFLFTPLQRSSNVSVTGTTTSTTTTTKSMSRGNSRPQTYLQLFLENNKAILTPYLVNQHQLSTSNNDHTPTPAPTTATNKITTPLMTFITPLKDSFSPLSPRDNDNDDADDTPINLNISADQVDDFIDEVISNTSKHTTPAFALLKKKKNKLKETPGGLFDVEAPSGVHSNDYSLMTPGIENLEPFRLEFEEDDEF